MQLLLKRLAVLLLTTSCCLMLFCCKERPGKGIIAALDTPAPGFTLHDIEGKAWSLADYHGKVVFLNFWATWCPPCREEMTSMDALNKSLAGEPFQMITILNNDTAASAQNFLNKIGVNVPVLLDPSGKIAKNYGVTGIPETFIIDPKGQLRKKMIGGRDWDSPLAREIIREYMENQ